MNLSIYLFIYLSVCMYVCMCIYIYIYIYIHDIACGPCEGDEEGIETEANTGPAYTHIQSSGLGGNGLPICCWKSMSIVQGLGSKRHVRGLGRYELLLGHEWQTTPHSTNREHNTRVSEQLPKVPEIIVCSAT